MSMIKLNNDKCYDTLGKAVRMIAEQVGEDKNIGVAIEAIYIVLVREAERDSRETFNRQQGETNE